MFSLAPFFFPDTLAGRISILAARALGISGPGAAGPEVRPQRRARFMA